MQDYFHLHMDAKQLQSVSETALAHVGDGVFELLIRSWLCCHGVLTNQELHRQTVALVTAPAQADFVARLLPLLTEEETAVYRRGRNCHTHPAPKSATPGQYARATGLETLLGWLYLTGQTERINTLFVAGMEAEHAL
ncbi:MAG: Mini-ribonuclease 3 [Faecousia sp.]|nr:ribonuclease III domain-containing protein [Candidatus Faecousia sp.]